MFTEHRTPQVSQGECLRDKNSKLRTFYKKGKLGHLKQYLDGMIKENFIDIFFNLSFTPKHNLETMKT